MKRIISTLLSLSLVLSLLPTVALAEGEDATKKLIIHGSSEILVGESYVLYAIDETGNVAKEEVKWTSADENIAQVQEPTNDDFSNWGIEPSSAYIKIVGMAEGTTTVTASTAERGTSNECTVTVKAPVQIESVTMQQPTKEVDQGQEFTLTCDVMPSDEHVTWTTSDAEIVSIGQMSNGTHTIGLFTHRAGTATITATANKDSTKFATCEVTVNAVNVPVQSISLNWSEYTIKDSKPLELIVNFNPTNATNKIVTWKSSNEAVATVDESGEVTAVGNGTANITATTEDGNFKATCQVTVEIPELTLSLDKSELTLTQTEEQQKLTATVSDPEEKVTWLSSDPFVATVTRDGTVTAIANGTATITASARDKTASCTVEVALTDTPAHTHVWSKSWDANVYYHYRRCQNRETCNFTSLEKQAGFNSHTFVNGKCSVCGRGQDNSKVQFGKVELIQPQFAYTGKEIEFVDRNNVRATLADGTTQDIPLSFRTRNLCKDGIPVNKCLEPGTYTAEVTAFTGLYEGTINVTITVVAPAHAHQYSDQWSSDATNHWHECQCGDKSAQGAHQFQWVIDRDATATTPGEKHQECTTCGYKTAPVTIPVEHVHKYSDKWSSDAANHWRECECGDKSAQGAHQFKWVIDRDATTKTGQKHQECTTCGYKTAPVTIPVEHVHKYSDKWSSDAANHWRECECGDKSAQGAHQFKWVIDRDATTKTGQKHQECTTCGYKTAPVTIPVKSAPTVTVKDSTVTVSNKSQTTKLDVKADEDAKLTYKSDNKSVKVDKNGKVTISKNFVGKATITVTATVNGVKTTKKVTVTVNPKGTTFRAVYNGAGKKLKAYWKRNSQVSGYQLQYGTNKNFTGCKTVTLKSNQYTGSVRAGLKKNATYYVRIRTYKRVSGKTYYSDWSKVKSFKVVR